jgi:iron complex outermembrane receptor protein
MKTINAFFWLFIFANAAHAESEFTEVSLKELMDVKVTSITKMPMSLNKSPVTAYVVSQDEIINKGYRFLTDVLKNTPGIHIANLSSSEQDVIEIYVRGILANNKITVLIDGVKIKSPTGEPINFLNSIPLIDMKQVEISFGSASSIYGADAMLATINLVTDNGAGIDGFRIKATGGSQDTGEVQVAAGKKINEDINISLTGSFHHSASEDLKQNYPDLFGNIDKVDLSDQNHNVHFKANYKDLTVSYYQLYQQNNSSVGFLPTEPGAYDYSGAATWANLYQTANATYNFDINPFWQAKSSLSYESHELLPKSNYRDYGAIEHKALHGEAIRFAQNIMYQRDKINWLSGTEFTFLESTPKYTVEDPAFNKVHTSYQN